MQLTALVSNMNINSEGFMLSEKVEFPLNDEEVDSLLERLKLNEDEPYSISTCRVVGDYTEMTVDKKLESFDEANDLGSDIWRIDSYDEDKFFAIVEAEDFDTAVDSIDNYILHTGGWEDIAKEVISSRYDISEDIWDYIDFSAYGEQQLDDGYYFMETRYGILEMC